MTALHHGNEWPTVELTMEFVHDLLNNDGADTLMTSLLERARLIVVPVVNPDGFDIAQRTSCRLERGRVLTWPECAAPVNMDIR